MKLSEKSEEKGPRFTSAYIFMPLLSLNGINISILLVNIWLLWKVRAMWLGETFAFSISYFFTQPRNRVTKALSLTSQSWNCGYCRCYFLWLLYLNRKVMCQLGRHGQDCLPIYLKESKSSAHKWIRMRYIRTPKWETWFEAPVVEATIADWYREHNM